MAKVTLMSDRGVDDLADEVLLDRYTSKKDEAAFAALVRRHGPLVLGVCRRVLQHEQNAEDAFQATFVVLARSAHRIRKRAAVGAWLHGVAYRIARKARQQTARQPVTTMNLSDLPSPEPAPEWVWREVGPVIDAEVDRLPEKLRRAFVLCHLEGRTNEQAAAELGCPTGTILSRLSRAREKLRARLTRRGLALSAAAWAAALGTGAAEAAVPPALIETAVRTASTLAGATTAGTAASTVSVLSEQYFRAMARERLLRIAAGALAGLVIVTVLLLSRVAAPTPVAGPAADRQLLQGAWDVTEVATAGQRAPNPGMKLTFAGDECTMAGNGFSIPARYELDPDRTPKQITLRRDADVFWPGIYKLDGDRLEICLNQTANGERPADFTASAQAGIFTYVMQRSRPP